MLMYLCSVRERDDAAVGKGIQAVEHVRQVHFSRRRPAFAPASVRSLAAAISILHRQQLHGHVTCQRHAPTAATANAVDGLVCYHHIIVIINSIISIIAALLESLEETVAQSDHAGTGRLEQ